MHLRPRASRPVVRVAEVVLDVAVAGRLPSEETPLELGDDHLVWLPDHVREHVQPPAMRHAEDHLLDTEAAGVLDERIEQRNQRITALEREALLGLVAELEELLEALGLDEPV